MSRPKYRLSFVVRPGRWPEAKRQKLVAELREVAAQCFDEVPVYQALTGEKAELDRCVLGLARRKDGTLAGFSSSLLLPVEGLGEVYHLGLTCVRPEDRAGGLTHRLVTAGVTGYLVLHKPFSRVWVSNVACVISSLGNIALHFEDIHPSPYRSAPPSPQHLAVARAISTHYRSCVAIDPQAVLDEEHFVFRGSVPGTVFEKDGNDERYHHRDERITRFYADRMDFSRGDEVIQVGSMSVAGYVRYTVRRWFGLGKEGPTQPALSA